MYKLWLVTVSVYIPLLLNVTLNHLFLYRTSGEFSGTFKKFSDGQL